MNKNLVEAQRPPSSVLRPQSLIIGLPVLLIGWLILSLLFSPLRTEQEKGSDALPLSSGQIVQSFVAEHPNLSKIYVKFGEIRQETSLQITVRRGSLDGPVVSQSNDFGVSLAGSLQAYEFPAQADSSGQTYFFTISYYSGPGSSRPAESTNLELVQSKNEVYPQGQLYLNGKPAQGDLFFIAEYSLNPGEMLKNFFDKQGEFGGLPALVLLCIFFTLLLAGLMLWLLARHYRELAGLFRGDKLRPWLVFGGLLLGLRLFLSLSFVLVTPPLQGPDEPGHIGRTLGLAEGKPDSAFSAPVADLMQRTRFIENFPWLSYADNPEELYPANAERLQLPLYYYVSSTLVKAGQLFNADFTAQNYLARCASVLMGLITVVAGLGLGYVLRRESVGLAVTLPLSVALLPEAAYLSGVTNNDNGAIAFGAISAWGMALLFMRGPRPLYFTIVIGGISLAILSKASANALLPGYVIGFYMLAWLRWRTRLAHRLLLALPVVALILGFMALFLLTDHSRAASAWYLSPTVETARHAERTVLSGAHTGQYVLKLAPNETPMEQQVNLFNKADFRRVKVSGWLKTAGNQSGETGALVRVQTAKDTLIEQRFPATPDWQPFSFEVDANAEEISHARIRAYLRLQVAASGNNSLYLDDLSMSPVGVGKPDLNLLANPSFEETVWTLKSDWLGAGRKVRTVPAEWLDAAQNGAALNYEDILIQNCLFLFITFWGAFGWSQVLFAGLVYLLGGILLLLAIIGLLRRAAWDFAPGTRAFACFGLFAVLTTILALQFIRLPTSWMYDGTPDITHSRHAFVTLLPQLFLLVMGLRGLRNFSFKSPRNAAKFEKSAIMPEEASVLPGSNANFQENSTDRRVWLGIWAWGTLLFFLSMLALLGTIFPFYYNS